MRFVLVVALLLAGCSGKPLPSYEELKKYPLSCKHQSEQLKELKSFQSRKNFSEDPELLNDEDRAYNALLHEHVWWFTYTCDQ